MSLLLKALFGALIVIVIQLLAKTQVYYIVALVPLFPTFTLISHYIIGTQRPVDELKVTIRFGLACLIPYTAYMLTLYLLVDKCKLGLALAGATLAWFVVAVLLILIWNAVV